MDLVSDLEWLYRQDLTKSSLGSTAVLRIVVPPEIPEMQRRNSFLCELGGRIPTGFVSICTPTAFRLVVFNLNPQTPKPPDKTYVPNLG